MVPKGPGSLEGLVRMWKICVILVLPGLQMSSHYVDTHCLFLVLPGLQIKMWFISPFSDVLSFNLLLHSVILARLQNSDFQHIFLGGRYVTAH